MFEENLQLNTPGFGFRSKPVRQRPISDIGPVRYSYPKLEPVQAQPHPEPAIEQVPIVTQAVPDAVELPDFLLRSPTTEPQSIDSKSRSLRKVMLYAFVTTVIAVGLVAAIGIFGSSQFARAQKYLPSIGFLGNNANSDKPSALAVANYQVGPELPKYIDISSLKIHSRIQHVGITDSGVAGTSINQYDVAWETSSSNPGDQGAMLLGANASSCVNPAVFYNLKKVVLGSDIQITRGDGQSFTYKVIKNQVYNADSVKMVNLLDPAVHGRPGLNIVTCAGQQDQQTGEFKQRLVINAVLY